MSRTVLEYFFDPEDFDPQLRELRRVSQAKPRTQNCPDAEVPFAPTRRAAQPKSQLEFSEKPELESEKTVPQDPIDKCSATHDNQGEDQPTSDNNFRSRTRRLLSVHELGQSVFCIRSAVLSIERGDDRDLDEPMPRLTFLPNYDQRRIEEMLLAKLLQLGFMVLYSICLGILLWIGLMRPSRLFFYPSLFALMAVIIIAAHTVGCIVVLAIRRQQAILAQASEPEPNITEIQTVNWWSMLKAGFESVSYDRPFQHPELALEGNPWRVLQRGNLRIPVIRSGSVRLGPGYLKLFPKHQVRLVAYALLLEAGTSLKTPYGLIFPANSARGIAFPISDGLRREAMQLIAELSRTVSDTQRKKLQPPLPPNRNHCKQCDYGKPVQTALPDVKLRDQAGQQLVVLQDRAGNLYRCECGDRFGSAPPHQLVQQKGLRTVVT